MCVDEAVTLCVGIVWIVCGDRDRGVVRCVVVVGKVEASRGTRISDGEIVGDGVSWELWWWLVIACHRRWILCLSVKQWQGTSSGGAW